MLGGSKLDERGRRMFAAGEVRTAGRGRLAAHDREGDVRHLVGKPYGDELEGLLLDQRLRPHLHRVGAIWLGLDLKQPCRTMHLRPR